MIKKLIAGLLVLVLCFAYVTPAGMAEEAEAPGVTEPVPELPEVEPEPTAEPEEPGTPEVLPEPEAPIPEPTPEELFLAAVVLLPQDPEAVETVTEELEEQLGAVIEQLYALLTEEQLAALADETGEAEGEEAALPEAAALSEPLRSAALLVLRLNARIAGLNAQAAQAVRDLIAALPAAEAMTVDHEAQVAGATAAYEALTATRKALLTGEEAAALAAAQARMAELLAKAKAALVDGMIGLLPEPDAITVSNYTEYETPAKEATDALTALSEYERGFVQSAGTLEEVIHTLEVAAKVSAWLDKVDLLASDPGGVGCLQYLTFAPGPKSVDTVLALEAEYRQFTPEELATYEYMAEFYAIFHSVLDVAQELAEIREHGRIIIPTAYFPLHMHTPAPMPLQENRWEGVSPELAGKYPLVATIREGDEEYISLEDIPGVGLYLGPLKATQEDVKILVYGSNAKALKELAASITVSVLADIDLEKIEGKAFTEDTVFTFDLRYTATGTGLQKRPVDATFAVGNYLKFGVGSFPGTTVRFTNKKLTMDWLTVAIAPDEFGISYNAVITLDADDPDVVRNAIYVTKLEYTIPLPSGEGTATALSNDIRIVITDKVQKVAFKPIVYNLFYEAAGGGYFSGDSYYKEVWLNQTAPMPHGPVKLTNLEYDKYPVTIDWDDDEGRYVMRIHGTKFAKATTWKVKFHVSEGGLAQEYDVTLPIAIKRVAPTNLYLKPKTAKIDDVAKQFMVSLCVKPGEFENLLWMYGIEGEISIAPKSAKYPYQEYFWVSAVDLGGDFQWLVYINPDLDKNLFELPGTFKLLVRVSFPGTGSFLDLPLTVSYPKYKLAPDASKAWLNQPAPGKLAATMIGYRNFTPTPPEIKTYTVSGVPRGPECPLAIEMEDGIKCIVIYGKEGRTLYGTSYYALVTLSNGQTLKLTISTNPLPNKLTLGQSSFTTDKKGQPDAISTSLTSIYLLDYDSSAVTLELMNGTAPGTLPDGVAAKWDNHRNVVLKGLSRLPVGKYTFRLSAPDQGVPAERGVILTLTVKDTAIQFSAALRKDSPDVLGDFGGIVTFDKLKITGNAKENYLANLDDSWDGDASHDSLWFVTAGGAGAKFLEVDGFDSKGVTLRWRDGIAGSYAMKQNGLTPIKLTLQLRSRAWGDLIAETKPFTVKPVQKPTIKPSYLTGSAVNMCSSAAYEQGLVFVDVKKWLDPKDPTAPFTDESVASVTIKGAEKSNYRAYLAANTWTPVGGPNDAVILIAYKSPATAKKAKASETITLILTLDNGVKPVEIKVPVKNLR